MGQVDQPDLFNQVLTISRDGKISRATADRAGVSTIDRDGIRGRATKPNRTLEVDLGDDVEVTRGSRGLSSRAGIGVDEGGSVSCTGYRTAVRKDGVGKSTDLVLRVFQLVDKHDFDEMAKLFSPDGELITPFSALTPEGAFRGREAIIANFAPLADSFPDSRHTIPTVIESGDYVVLEGRWSGTNTGDFSTGADAIQATGKHVDFAFAGICKVKGDMVESVHIHHDRWLMFHQLGLM